MQTEATAPFRLYQSRFRIDRECQDRVGERQTVHALRDDDHVGSLGGGAQVEGEIQEVPVIGLLLVREGEPLPLARFCILAVEDRVAMASASDR